MTSELRTSLLSTTQLNTITGRIVEITLVLPSEYPLLIDINTALKKEHDKLNAALNRERASAYTEELGQRDEMRDMAFLTFRNITNGYVTHSDEDIRNSAVLLYNIIEKHGVSLYNLGYSDQSGKMNQLLADCEQTEVKDAVKKLGLSGLYDTMELTHKDFEKLYLDKTAREQSEVYKLADIKPRINFLIASLIDNIYIAAEFKPDLYKAIANQITEAVEDTMTIAKTRKKRQENEEKGE